MIELEETHARTAANACLSLAEDQDKMANECQKAADAGMSNELVADYTPLVGVFRDSANSYRRAYYAIMEALDEE